MGGDRWSTRQRVGARREGARGRRAGAGWRLLVACAAGLLPRAARAEGLEFDVEPGGPLRATVTLDENTSSASTTLRVRHVCPADTARRASTPGCRGDPVTYLLRAEDLRMDDSPVTIPASDVKFSPSVALPDGAWSDIAITIQNIRRQGTYHGALHFTRVDRPVHGGDDGRVPLTVVVGRSPRVEVDGRSLTLRMVGPAVAGHPSSYVLPSKLRGRSLGLVVSNPLPDDVEVQSIQAHLRGGDSGAVLATGQGSGITLEVEPGPVPAHRQRVFALRIPDGQAPLPDRYTGRAYLYLKGRADPVAVDVTILVRDTPWKALAAVFLGLFLGLIGRGAQTALVARQLRLLPQYYALRRLVAGVTDATSRGWLDTELEILAQEIDDVSLDEAKVKEHVEALGRQGRFLLVLDGLMNRIAKLPPGDPRITELQAQVVTARRACREGDFKAAEDARRKILDILEKAASDSKGAPGDRETFEAGLRLMASAPPPGPSSRPAGAGLLGPRFLGRLFYWVGRPSVAITLAVLAALAAWWQLYVTQGDTFGAAALADYGAALALGVAAGYVKQTLEKPPRIGE